MKLLSKLAQIASKQQPGEFDVCDDVIRAITTSQEAEPSLVPLDIFAAVSAVAASVVVFVSTGGYLDSLARLFMPVAEVPIW